jgi:hypothetical protein
MSLGIRSGVNWIRLKVQRFGDGLHHQRLGEPGHTDQERVASGEHRGENPVDRLGLAHDTLRHLGAEPAHGADQALQLLNVVGRRGLRCRHEVSWSLVLRFTRVRTGKLALQQSLRGAQPRSNPPAFPPGTWGIATRACSPLAMTTTFLAKYFTSG